MIPPEENKGPSLFAVALGVVFVFTFLGYHKLLGPCQWFFEDLIDALRRALEP